MEAVRPVARVAASAPGRDWTLPLVMGLVLAIVTAVPYAYAYIVQPHDQVFMGFFYLGDDANTYLAKMRQGWEGAWSWQNRYTTEASPSAYLFMFWILLGHIGAILQVPLIAVFHGARIAAAFALMGAAWLFISHFIEDRSARRFAFFFVAIGLGLGYVIQALGHPVIFGNRTDTLDWRMPELTAFYSVLPLPHFAWSGVFAGLGVALTLKAIQRGSLVLGALAGVAWLGQASIHPQMPILMGGATAVALFLRPAPPRGWMAATLAFAIPAPYILYSYFAFVGNPEVQRWTFHSKNALPPETVSLVFALAPQLLLALTGIPGALRRRSREDVFLLAWLVLLAAILYLPNPAGDLRRRFLDALYLPLVVLGARGMYELILPRLRSVRARASFPSPTSRSRLLVAPSSSWPRWPWPRNLSIRSAGPSTTGWRGWGTIRPARSYRCRGCACSSPRTAPTPYTSAITTRRSTITPRRRMRSTCSRARPTSPISCTPTTSDT